MRIFILEDEIDQYPREQLKTVLQDHVLTIAKSCEAGKALYLPGQYDLLLLDHDMEGNYEYRPEYPNTGMQFVKWLVEHETKFPEIIIHSHNHIGAGNMKALLQDHGFSVLEFPFGPQYVRALKQIKEPA